jgi:hypothetical protein
MRYKNIISIAFTIALANYITGCKNNEFVFYKTELIKEKNQCTDEPYIKMTFKINNENNVGLLTLAEIPEGFKLTRKLEDCKIIDSENFVCGGKFTDYGKNEEWIITNDAVTLNPGISIIQGKSVTRNNEIGRCIYKKTIFGKTVMSR